MKKLIKKKDKELAPFVRKLLIDFSRRLLQFGRYLQKKTNRYSKNTKKGLLLLFCVVFITESTLVIIHSFQKNPISWVVIGSSRRLPVTQIPRKYPVFTKTESERIDQFRKYLDSHVIFRDSLLAARPHLMDTLNYLQKLYKQNENGK